MTRIIIPMPTPLLAHLDRRIPAGQSRAEWIREAVRRRLKQDEAQPEPATQADA